MTSSSDSLRQRLRQMLAPLRATPLHPQWLLSRFRRHRTAWVLARASGHVLDVGCADRAWQALLVHAERYTGLDHPATATALYGTRPDVYGNACQLPLADASVDTVLLLDVLEHLAQPELALAEACRVLRPGGHVVLTLPFVYPMHDQPFDYQRLTEHGLRFRLQQAGFSRIILEESGGAIEAAALQMALALAQGVIEACTRPSWRLLLVPLAVLLLPLINLLGALLGALWPVSHFAPGTYHVQACKADTP